MDRDKHARHKPFKRLEIVTGCVRAGTQFLVQVLADKYKCNYLREQSFNYRDWDLFLNLLKDCPHDEIIIHAPCLRHKCRELKKIYPEIKIYWMTRNFEEAQESIKKMLWTPENCQVEMIQYLDIMPFDKNLFKDDYEALVVTCYFLGEMFFREGLIEGGIIDMEKLTHHKSFNKRTKNPKLDNGKSKN